MEIKIKLNGRTVTDHIDADLHPVGRIFRAACHTHDIVAVVRTDYDAVGTLRKRS